jgi:hypothetical protein
MNKQLPLKYSWMVMLFQLLLMICVSDLLEMLKLVTNSTRMYIPAPKLSIINHIDKYNSIYQTVATISIVLMGLTNSIVLESSTQFPIGWLCGAPITIILLHCCSCLKRFIPHVFDIGTDSLRIYEFLHEQRFVIFGVIAWSIFTFVVLVYLMIMLKMYG